MGCETSREENHDIVSIVTSQQFQLSYKQLIAQDRGHIFELYHFSTIINRSNTSIVRKVISRASQQARVCKIVSLVNQKYFTTISEIEFLKKLDHPNIVQPLEFFIEPSFIYMVLEDIPGDRLLRELNKITEGVSFVQIVQIMNQLLRTVDFCHRKQIAHRAITTENIMLFFDQDKAYIKLIDFSQACTIDCSNPHPVLNQKRNIILGQHQANETCKIDIYDCGIVFYSLISGQRIRPENPVHDYQEIIFKVEKSIQSIGLDAKIYGQFVDLIRLMLNENPACRPTASQCLESQFFAHFKKQASSRKAIEGMIKFQTENNLKYLLSLYASLNMTSVLQKAQYMSEFYSLDTNGDGEIQMDELVEGIQNTFNVKAEKAKEYAEMMFENMDKNKSGSINFSEYITGTIGLSKLLETNFLVKMFNEIDIDKDGVITESDLNGLIMGIDRYEVLGNRKLDLSAFKKLMTRLISSDSEVKNKID